MTEYNSVSGVRFGLQIATTALFYFAGRYKKIDGLSSAASRIGVATVLQGVSQKVRSPLGERSNVNWLIDGMALGLVAYGMSYTDLAKRTKGLVGGAIFGSQLVISNVNPHTVLARIAKIETKEENEEVYQGLTEFLEKNKESISPAQGIKVCKAFFLKATPLFERDFSGSPPENVMKLYGKFLDKLEGLERIKAETDYMEVLNQGGVKSKHFLLEWQLSSNLEGREKEHFDGWMEKIGTHIHLRWTVWNMSSEDHQAVLGRTTEYLRAVGDKITFAQKINLCEEFFKNSINHHFNTKPFKNTPPNKIMYLREELMETLEGTEKAKAYMDYVEFLDGAKIIHFKVFRKIQEIMETLDESGKAAVDAWMAEKGTAIQTSWEK